MTVQTRTLHNERGMHMSNVSRRSFLKGLAAGTASLGALGLANAAGAMAFAETSGKGVYTPGTYTSVQSTDFATIEVKCTFSDTAITDVGYTLLETTSDDYFARMTAEAEEYCQKIVAAGNPAEVDGISGATLCTTALSDGVNACRAQALGVPLPAATAAPAAAVNPQYDDFRTNSSADLSKSPLFSDWQLGGRTFNHRMVKSAAFQLAFLRRNPEEYINYYKRMADGGVQLIWIEDFADIWAVTSGGPFKGPLEEYDVKGLVDALHGAGCTIGYQFDTMGAPIGPLDFTEPFLGNYDTETIRQWVQDIIGIGKKLQDNGFDAFELNFAANNLGQSFFSRARNNRTDEYGPQTLESRCKFAEEVITGLKETCGKDFITDPGLNRTLLGDGLATALAGFIGGPANTTYGENTGVLELSHVHDPRVIRLAAIYAIILSFFPKVAELIGTMPSAIIGGISFILYGMISAIGVRNVVENRVDFKNSRNLIVAAVILVTGLGFSDGLTFTIGSTSITLTSLALASIFGIVLNAILPYKDYNFNEEEAGELKTADGVEEEDE